MLQNPGVPVRNKDGIEAGGQRRIDVGLGLLPIIHVVSFEQGVLSTITRVSLRRLSRDDLDGGEVIFHARALDFAGLLRNRTFGHRMR